MKSLYKYRIVTYNRDPNTYVLQKKVCVLRVLEQKINKPFDFASAEDTLSCIIAFIPFGGFFIIGIMSLIWLIIEIKVGWNDFAISDCPLKLEQKVSKHKQENYLTYPDTYKVYLKL